MTPPLPLASRAVRLGMVLPFALLAACVDGGAPSDTGRCVPKVSGTAETMDLPGLPGLPGGGTTTGGLSEVTSFGENPAALRMYLHAPASGAASAVVVALHGCAQTASAYASAGWNELADQAGLAIVYAEQTATNNGQRCFRWWDAAQTKRDAGEAKSIASMAEWAKAKYGVSHAFVTGLSAGGAMTAVLLAAYPDLFEAGAVMSGLPYGCATSQNDAYACMSPGKDKTPSDWAALLPPDAKGGKAPRVSIWHGDADYTVRPANAEALVRQWTAANGIAATASSSDTVGPATHDVYQDATGTTRVERWLVKGMGHGVVLDAKNGCGKAGAFLVDKGLCSTMLTAQFFGLVAPDGTPTTPPPPAHGSSSSSAGSTDDDDCD